MSKSLLKIIIIASLFGVAQSSIAKDFFGKNNPWGNFGGFGNSNGNNCSDWPEWTPMYWMEEMSGSNNCYPNAYGGGYANKYPYQSPYAYPSSAYGTPPPNPYLANNQAYNPYAAGGMPPAYGYNPYMANMRGNPQANHFNGSRKSTFSPLGNRGLTSFPRFGGSGLTNPFSSFSGASSPFSSFGGGSPWSSFGSPMSPMGFGGGMPGMTPFSPMGGFGSPMSPMSMGTMGMMPGMSPLGGFGSNPFGGGSSFNPFSR